MGIRIFAQTLAVAVCERKVLLSPQTITQVFVRVRFNIGPNQAIEK